MVRAGLELATSSFRVRRPYHSATMSLLQSYQEMMETPDSLYKIDVKKAQLLCLPE